MDIASKVLELGLPAEKQAETPKQVLVRVDRAAKKTDTDPTEAQKDSGRYQKGRVGAHGLRIAIENPRGSIRSGTGADGKKWSTKMHAHYGYIEGTTGKDLDPVDVFIGDEPHSEYVLVINQVDPKTKLFDEHKVMIGYTSRKGAENCYMSNYEDGWQGMGKTTPMTMDQFRDWLKEGNQNKPAKPLVVKSAAIGAYPITVDRPAGFKKTFKTLEGPVEKEYPVDYGYFDAFINPDDEEGLDVFVGQGGPHYGRFMKGQTLTGKWQPDERKWYAGLSDEQLAAVMDMYLSQHPELLQDFQTFEDEKAFLKDVQAQGRPAQELKAAEDDDDTAGEDIERDGQTVGYNNEMHDQDRYA
jgi:inorganic pyrophosphatase